MNCPHCGAENRADSKLCANCGRELVPEPEPTVELQRSGGAVPADALPPVPPPPPPPSVPAPRPASGIAAGWPTALLGGLLAFVVMALLGQLLAFSVYFAGGPDGRPSIETFVRVGWFYFGAFHHVDLVASVSDFDLGDVGEAGAGGLFQGGGDISYGVGLSLMLATALAVFLLYRAGRRVAESAGGGPLARALHGLKVAPAYALPAFVLSLIVSFRVQIPQNPVFAGAVKVRSSPVQSLIIPLLIAAVAGAAGGLRSGRDQLTAREPMGRRLAGALSGGWRMFVLGLLLSLAGLFVAGAVQPDSVEGYLTPSTAAYFRAVFSEDVDEGAVVLGHHILVLPNEAMLTLVPSMGGCDGAYGARVSQSLLCYWKFPVGASVPDADGQTGLATQIPRLETDVVPLGYFLFLLAPIVAVLLGGRRAAGRGGARSANEAGALGAGAGVVFAVLVVAGSWLASITVGGTARFGGVGGGSSVRLGPDIVLGGLIALAWGVVGGWLGGRFQGGSGSARPADETGDAGFLTSPSPSPPPLPPEGEPPPEPPPGP